MYAIKFELGEIDDLKENLISLIMTGRSVMMMRLKENLDFSWHHGLDKTLRCHVLKETIQKELLKDEIIRRVMLRLDHGYEFLDDNDDSDEFKNDNSYCGNRYCLGDCLTCLGMD